MAIELPPREQPATRFVAHHEPAAVLARRSRIHFHRSTFRIQRARLGPEVACPGEHRPLRYLQGGVAPPQAGKYPRQHFQIRHIAGRAGKVPVTYPVPDHRLLVENLQIHREASAAPLFLQKDMQPGSLSTSSVRPVVDQAVRGLGGKCVCVRLQPDDRVGPARNSSPSILVSHIDDLPGLEISFRSELEIRRNQAVRQVPDSLLRIVTSVRTSTKAGSGKCYYRHDPDSTHGRVDRDVRDVRDGNPVAPKMFAVMRPMSCKRE
jgi:hypothetical protein